MNVPNMDISFPRMEESFLLLTICAKLDLDCTVYMGAVHCGCKKFNVFRMNMLGVKVVAVEDGQRTLKILSEDILDALYLYFEIC